MGHQATLTRNGHKITFESKVWNSVSFQLLGFLLLIPCLGFGILCFLGYLLLGGIWWLIASIIAFFGIFCGAWTVAASFYPRRFVFDFDRQTCTFSNIPGLGLSIPFSDIEAIDILRLRLAPNVLGLAYGGKTRRLRIHMFHATKKNVAEIDKEMSTLTEALSKLLDRPVRIVPKATNRLNSWR